jgi:hypothetical protein
MVLYPRRSADAPTTPGPLQADRCANRSYEVNRLLLARERASEPYRPDSTRAAGDEEPAPILFRTDIPVPDPFEDAQSIEDLEHEIVTIFANVHAGNHRALVLIAEFHRRRGWELGGHRSTAHWLHFRTGLDLGAAREKVRAALALEGLPLISEAMGRGELSFSKVRALTRVATPESEGELLEVAREMTTAELERCVRAWKHLSREEEASLEKVNYRRRRLSVFPDESGAYVVRGVVTAEVGALLMRAVEAASDALFSAEAKDETTPEQRRADALGLLAERAMAAGFGGTAGAAGTEIEAAEDVSAETLFEGGANEGSLESGGEAVEDVSAEPRSARRRQTFLEGGANGRSQGGGGEDAEGGEVDAAIPTPISGTHAERYQVVLHVDPATLDPRGEPGRSNLEDGVRVSAETSRRLCCDSALVKVLRGPDGEVLDVGRRTRTIPPAIRRALEVRDGGCRWPGCNLRFTAAHHVEHWAEGGETRLGNLLLLCSFHHRKVHEGGWKALYNEKDDTALFFGPKGVLRYTRRGLGRIGGNGRGPNGGGRSSNGNGRSSNGNGRSPNGNGRSPNGGGRNPEGSDVEEGHGSDNGPGVHRGNSVPGSLDRLIQRNRSAGITPDGWTPTARAHGWGLDPWDLELRAWETLDREPLDREPLDREPLNGDGDRTGGRENEDGMGQDSP